ncbi:hypothetical protein JX265_007889 [Neoarthrinium moseri]|uniref:Cytochrome P450 n=1 Tax=Neoarthrinium moseri TaxID=1658444 RepID=A0A9Q0AP94_9PEZI|nr:hypothetical protein JX265_007889 [Neoarthrinium moseri]
MAPLALFSKHFTSAFIVCALFLFGYRLLLHPLRKYPGPFFAKLSDVYGGYFAAARRLHLRTYQDHLQYGAAHKSALTKLTKGDIYQNERLVKPSIYRASEVRPGQNNVFNSRDKKIHSAKRRLVGQALSDQSLRRFEPTLLEQVDTFIRILYKASDVSRAVDMTLSCRHLGLDTIGQLGFGYDLKIQSEEEHRFLKKAIVFTNFRINLALQLPALINFRPDLIATYLPNSIRKRLLAVVEKMIATRLAQPINAKHDLLSFITPKLQTDLKDIQSGELWPEAVFFFGAGGDTTATAMAGAFFYLSRNSDCYKQLAAEIRTTFNSAGEIRGGPQLAGCRYLRACIDESLRMASPVGTTLWRELDSQEAGRCPLVVDGHSIPHGTLVGVNIYSLHHNEDYFPDPFTFRPERWLDDGADKARAAFAPFSVGPRTCAGKPLAYQEISLALAKTLWYFDFEPAPGYLGDIGGGTPGKTDGRGRVGEYQTYDIFGAYHDGPYLVFHPRHMHCDELKHRQDG